MHCAEHPFRAPARPPTRAHGGVDAPRNGAKDGAQLGEGKHGGHLVQQALWRVLKEPVGGVWQGGQAVTFYTASREQAEHVTSRQLLDPFLQSWLQLPFRCLAPASALLAPPRASAPPELGVEENPRNDGGRHVRRLVAGACAAWQRCRAGRHRKFCALWLHAALSEAWAVMGGLMMLRSAALGRKSPVQRGMGAAPKKRAVSGKTISCANSGENPHHRSTCGTGRGTLRALSQRTQAHALLMRATAPQLVSGTRPLPHLPSSDTPAHPHPATVIHACIMPCPRIALLTSCPCPHAPCVWAQIQKAAPAG